MAGVPKAYPINGRKIGHLRKADEISSVFDFKCRISSSHFIALAKPNHLSFPRMVIMVPKRTERLAVRRNYMRRVFKEFCRTREQHIGSVDVVIRIIKPYVKLDYARITQEIESVIVNLKKCRAP
jgi:ribonuclease P protein component